MDSHSGDRKDRRIQFIYDLLNRTLNFIDLGSELLNEFMTPKKKRMAETERANWQNQVTKLVT